MARNQTDRVMEAVRTRFLSCTTSDDLWVSLISDPWTFARRDTEFVRVNKDTLVVHVENPAGELRSFAIKVTELVDDPDPQQRLEV
jgi:hypothetical protein